MTTQLTTKRVSQTRFIVLIAVWYGATLASVHAQKPEATKAKSQYQVSSLSTLGGTSNAGNSINNLSWVAGYSRLTGNQSRHAALWRNGSLSDLGTLGGPNSSVTWNVKNTQGIIVGISQTADPEPLGEAWSSAAFYTGPFTVGFINLGFVWEQNQMRGLPNFPGGNNGFATGANNLRQAVGWAENGVHDGACVSPQVLRFLPAKWTLGPPDQIQDLPLFPGDTSGAATAINDNGQIVGISGICDQAVGRHTAKHAVLWENGGVIDLGNLGAQWWNTTTAPMGGYCCSTVCVASSIVAIGDVLLESYCHTYTFVSGRAEAVSAAAGSLVALSSASTATCGPTAGLTEAKLWPWIGPDQSKPLTPPERYVFTGGVLSLPAEL